MANTSTKSDNVTETEVENTRENNEEVTLFGTIRDNSGACSTTFCGHEEEHPLFCESHAVVCCRACFRSDHCSCESVGSVRNIHFDISRQTKRLNQLLCSVQDRASKLKSHNQRIEFRIESGKTEIKDFYEEIRRKVDEAEKSDQKKLEHIRELEFSGTEFYIDECDILGERLRAILDEGVCIDKYVKEPKLLSPVANPVSGDHEEEKVLRAFRTEKTADLLRFTRKHREQITQIERKIEGDKFRDDFCRRFIEKNEEVTECLVSNIPRCLNISALCPTNRRPVRGFTLSRDFSFDGIVNSIVMLPYANGEFLVVTDIPVLQCVSPNGKLRKSVPLPSSPNDLCVYSKFVAVTFKDLSSMNIYHLHDLSLHYEISLSGDGWGICRIDNSFVVAFSSSNRVRRIGDHGTVISESDTQIKFKNPTFVRTSGCGRNVLISDTNNNRVVALSPCNNLKSILYTVDLKAPLGLCVVPTLHEGIFVCNELDNFVGEVTKDGDNAIKIDTDFYGISKPKCLCYNVHNRTLAVACGREVKVFEAD